MDNDVVLWLNQWARSSWWATTLTTFFAQRAIYLLPIALLALAALSGPRAGERRRVVLASIINLAFVAVVVVVLGALVDRARPFVSLAQDVHPLFAHAPDSSFPSDHTLIGVALAAPLALAAPRTGWPLLLLALAIGFARVAAGVHFATDIIGSAIIAFLLAFPALLLASRLIARLPARLVRLAGFPAAQPPQRQGRDSA